MDGNDGRYDKSKPRAATDQYSSRQYERRQVVAARATGSPPMVAHVSDAHSLRRSWQPKTQLAAQDAAGSPRFLGCQLRKN